jgi:transposase
MTYFVGIDVSLEESSICIVDASGKVVREARVASEPESLVEFFRKVEFVVSRIGLEAGPLSQWLYDGLSQAGFEVVLLETRHVKAALSAMVVKTDRKDARGIAQLLRMGWFRPVHAKSFASRDVRALLTARKLLQSKLIDVELSIRGLLRGFGLKMGKVSNGRFEARVIELVAGHVMLEEIMMAMLRGREVLRREYATLHRQVLSIARACPVCRRLMTAPGVGPVVALTFMSAVDDPHRFRRSESVGAHFGMTPRKYQSGETDVTGSISRVGDTAVRTTLYQAAHIILSREMPYSSLKSWAMGVAKRRGLKRAKVACARKLATILHRMWVEETDFRWSKETTVAA